MWNIFGSNTIWNIAPSKTSPKRSIQLLKENYQILNWSQLLRNFTLRRGDSENKNADAFLKGYV